MELKRIQKNTIYILVQFFQRKIAAWMLDTMHGHISYFSPGFSIVGSIWDCGHITTKPISPP
jgi:hypothetical protein